MKLLILLGEATKGSGFIQNLRSTLFFIDQSKEIESFNQSLGRFFSDIRDIVSTSGVSDSIVQFISNPPAMITLSQLTNIQKGLESRGLRLVLAVVPDEVVLGTGKSTFLISIQRNWNGLASTATPIRDQGSISGLYRSMYEAVGLLTDDLFIEKNIVMSVLGESLTRRVSAYYAQRLWS